MSSTRVGHSRTSSSSPLVFTGPDPAYGIIVRETRLLLTVLVEDLSSPQTNTKPVPRPGGANGPGARPAALWFLVAKALEMALSGGQVAC